MNYDKYSKLALEGYFDSIFETIILIAVSIKKHSYIRGYFDFDKIKTNFSSSQKLITLSLELMYNAYGESVHNFVLDNEYQCICKMPISDDEISELTLAVRLLKYLKKWDIVSIDVLFGFLCYGEIRSELSGIVADLLIAK